MTPTKKKFKEVYINLWEFYNPPSLSRSMYVAILIYAKTQVMGIVFAIKK